MIAKVTLLAVVCASLVCATPLRTKRADRINDLTKAEILKDVRQNPTAESAAYGFEFESSDGIARSEVGSPVGDKGTVVQAGVIRFPLADGTIFEMKFVADENGFQPQSDFIPIGPPMPPHARAQLEAAERLRQAASA
ncbi:cuticle protein AMP4-like [Oratosquilla oratoria]|uniref:cuticle protein AMP4-like n=1 Tax=Oratosquilla oratoria TaxID=337810 RepID=UPI003F7576E8